MANYYPINKVKIAAQEEDIKTLDEAISCGFDINHKIKFNEYIFDESVLMYACGSPKIKLVRWALSKNANVNIQNKYGQTSLMRACSCGDYEIVNLLLSQPNINVNCRDENKNCAFSYIIHNFNYVVEELLLHPDIDVNSQDKSGYTILIEASKGGHIETIEKLLSISKINVNIQNWVGVTALIAACESGHTEIVKKLLSHPNVDINIPKNDGNTPLMVVVCLCNHNLVELLLSHPMIQVNLKNKYRESALDLAKDPQIIKMLENKLKKAQ